MGLINVQLEANGPITQMDESGLNKRWGGIDNDDETTTWVEYYLKSDPSSCRPVHRSADVKLKKPAVFAEGVAAQL